jgi:hypothetical protein
MEKFESFLEKLFTRFFARAYARFGALRPRLLWEDASAKTAPEKNCRFCGQGF